MVKYLGFKPNYDFHYYIGVMNKIPRILFTWQNVEPIRSLCRCEKYYGSIIWDSYYLKCIIWKENYTKEKSIYYENKDETFSMLKWTYLKILEGSLSSP